MSDIENKVISIITSILVGLFTFYIEKYFKNKNRQVVKQEKLNPKEELRKKKLLDQKYTKKVSKYNNCEVDYYEKYKIKALFKNIVKYECLNKKLNLQDRTILATTSNRITFGKKKVKVRLNKVMEIYVQYSLLFITFSILMYTVYTFTLLIITTSSIWLKLFFLFVILLPGTTVVFILKNLVEPEQARILQNKIKKLSKKDHLEIVKAKW